MKQTVSWHGLADGARGWIGVLPDSVFDTLFFDCSLTTWLGMSFPHCNYMHL